MGIWYLREKFCSAPVVKPWGKKKPASQNTGGLPFTSQSRMKSTLAFKSFTHDASGLSDGYAAASHTRGTLLSLIATYTESSSSLMSASPLMARCSSDSVRRSTPSSRLKRAISCFSTVPSESMCSPWNSNVRSPASVSSRSPGSCARMSAASSDTTSSVLLPVADEVLRGWMARHASSSCCASACWNEMAAFALMPNTSGWSTSGSART
mmetsp:Transcript_20942/g.67407  ORF Transcript_20942/g.67407 Transcript_20942/m.67407 type:complete len:210 (-) Transcript_20942:617-1246(-)